MTQIVSNRIKTPDGTILVSHTRHDYHTYDDANGKVYMIDGGNEYLRRNGHEGEYKYKELTVYVTDPHDQIREVFDWGTYGISGDKKLHRIILKDMETRHIENVLANTSMRLPGWREKIFIDELEYRNNGSL